MVVAVVAVGRKPLISLQVAVGLRSGGGQAPLIPPRRPYARRPGSGGLGRWFRRYQNAALAERWSPRGREMPAIRSRDRFTILLPEAPHRRRCTPHRCPWAAPRALRPPEAGCPAPIARRAAFAAVAPPPRHETPLVFPPPRCRPNSRHSVIRDKGSNNRSLRDYRLHSGCAIQ